MRGTHALLLLVLASGCKCGSSVPAPLDTDGNFVVGDARVGRSDGAADGASADALEDGALDGERDAGALDGRDGGAPPDTGPDTGFPPSCLESPAASVTATEAVARRTALSGAVIDVRGTAAMIGLACTGGPCDAGSCCQVCTATVALDRVLPLRGSECFEATPGCRGNECGLVCRPPLVGVRQTFRGRLRGGPDAGSAALQLFFVNP